MPLKAYLAYQRLAMGAVTNMPILAWARETLLLPKVLMKSSKKKEGREIYFGGGLFAKSMPFSMLPLRPLRQASSSFFSWSLTDRRTFSACSAPEGYSLISLIPDKLEARDLAGHTPSSTGTEKNSTPASFAIASPPGIPGR